MKATFLGEYMGTKIVYEGGEGELIEKKSRFIATVKPVDSEEEAMEFITGLRKKYWKTAGNGGATYAGCTSGRRGA